MGAMILETISSCFDSPQVPSPLEERGSGRGVIQSDKDGHQHKKIKQRQEVEKNQTEAEHRLWNLVRNRALASQKFRRQYVIGPYTCDFVCIEKQLVVEIDGGQHALQVEQDENRTAYLRSQGFTVIRFWNHEVLAETEAVLEKILDAIES